MADEHLSEHSQESLEQSKQRIEASIGSWAEQAAAHHENVIMPMLAFVYPERPPIATKKPRDNFPYRTSEFDTVFIDDPDVGSPNQRTERRSVQYFVETITPDISLEMILIPGGTFTMGELAENCFEGPLHQVNVPSFHMGFVA